MGQLEIVTPQLEMEALSGLNEVAPPPTSRAEMDWLARIFFDLQSASWAEFDLWNPRVDVGSLDHNGTPWAELTEAQKWAVVRNSLDPSADAFMPGAGDHNKSRTNTGQGPDAGNYFSGAVPEGGAARPVSTTYERQFRALNLIYGPESREARAAEDAHNNYIRVPGNSADVPNWVLINAVGGVQVPQWPEAAGTPQPLLGPPAPPPPTGISQATVNNANQVGGPVPTLNRIPR